MDDVPRFLFIPVSGPGGAGEYFRTLAVARGLERRWPGCSIKFVVSRDATYSQGGPYPALLLDRSPTFEAAAVARILEQERPHVVVFDSAGCLSQYLAAQRVGARVVYVSSRPSTRRKGFRLRRLLATDQFWIAQPRFLGGGLTLRERWKRKLAPHLEVLFLEVLHEPVDEEGTRSLQQRLGVQPGGYLLACPGGGGIFGDGRDAAQVFFGAASRVARETAVPVVAVPGLRFLAPANPPPGLHLVPSLPNGQLMGMLRDARVGMVNGGSLLLQAMAQQSPCVAAPVADDQPRRIARAVACGYARSAVLDAAALAGAAAELLGADAEREALRGRLARLGLRNGVDIAAGAVGRLLPAAPAGEAR
jgi:hypothetical protein